jgi:hypothetical protein
VVGRRNQGRFLGETNASYDIAAIGWHSYVEMSRTKSVDREKWG